MQRVSFQKILNEAQEAYSDDEPLNEDASELEIGVDNITLAGTDGDGDDLLSVRFDSVLLQQVKANKVKYNKELKSKLRTEVGTMANPYISKMPHRTKKVMVIGRTGDIVATTSSKSSEAKSEGGQVGAGEQFCFPQYDWSCALDDMMNNRKRGRSDSLEDEADACVASSSSSSQPELSIESTVGVNDSVLPIIGSVNSAAAFSTGDNSMFDGCFDNDIVSLRDFILRSVGGGGGADSSAAGSAPSTGSATRSLLDELNQIVAEEMNRSREGANLLTMSYEDVVKALERGSGGLLRPTAADAAVAVSSPVPVRDRPPVVCTKEEKTEKLVMDLVAKIKRLRKMKNARVDLDAASSMEEEFKNQFGSKVYAKAMVAFQDQEVAQKESKEQAKESKEQAKAQRQLEKQRERENQAQAQALAQPEAESKEEAEGAPREVNPSQMRLLKLRGILKSPLAPQTKTPIWRCLPNASGVKASAKLNNLTPLHMLIARSHKNIPRVDLFASELRYFHRPHMPSNHYNKSWVGTYIPLTNSYAMQSQASFQYKDGRADFAGGMQQAQLSQTQAIDKHDLSLLTGDFVVIEYIEEKPPVVLNVGMASSIVNYYRTQVDEGASGSAGDAARFTGSSAVEKLSHRVPQHVIQLLAKRNVKSFFESDLSGPKLAVGDTKILESRPNPIPDSINSNSSNDDQNISEQMTYLENLKDVNQNGPFLGNLQLDEMQQAIHNSLFKAPLFCHYSSSNPASSAYSDGPMSQFTSNDFLLVRSKLSVKSIHYHVRELPLATGGVFVCGQIEPLQVVPKPAPNKAISKIQEKMFRLALARYLYTNPNGVEFKEAQDHILKFSKRKHTFRDNYFKKILKSVGDEHQNIHKISSTGNIATKWFAKSYTLVAEASDDPSYAIGGKSAANLDWLHPYDHSYNFDKLETSVFPEEVCVQESCNAGEYALGEVGIFEVVEVVKVQQYIMTLMNVRQARERKVVRLLGDIASAQSAYATKTDHIKTLDELVGVLLRELRRLDEKILVCRFIVEKLVLTPWHVTEGYEMGHVQYDVGGRNTSSNVATSTTAGGMTLTATVGRIGLFGMGDPSGVGEAYAFVRVPKLSLTDRRKSKGRVLYNTDSDIRSLPRAGAEKIAIEAGYERKECKKLPRWDLMHLVREIATKAFTKKVGNVDLWKYARGLEEFPSDTDTSTTSYITDELKYKNKCNDIWNKQANALTVSSLEDFEDDDDDDDFYSDSSGQSSVHPATAAEKELADSVAAALQQQQKEQSDAQSSRSRDALVASQVSNRTEKSGYKDFSKFLSTISVAKPKAKVSVAGGRAEAGGEDMVMDALDQDIGLVGAGRADSGGAGQQAGDSAPAAPRFSIQAPTKAVKRITTITNAETGIQTVKIQYSVLHTDAVRVSQNSKKKLQQHEYVTVPRRKEWEAAMSNKKQNQGADRGGSSAINSNYSGWNFYEDCEDTSGAVAAEVAAAEATSLKLNLGALKGSGKATDIDDADQYNQSAKTRIGGSSTRGGSVGFAAAAAPSVRGPGRPSASKMMTGAGGSSNSLNKVAMYKDARLPQLMLAVKLEKILMDCWAKKGAITFWYPVDVTKIVGYRERVQFPICLNDIRDKVGRLTYCSSVDFLDDLKLMAYNSILFNTLNHAFSQVAVSIVSYAAAMLANERNTMGAESDSFRLLETAISAKYRAFNIPLNLHTSNFDSKVMILPTNATDGTATVKKTWTKTGATAGAGKGKVTRAGAKGRKGAAAAAAAPAAAESAPAVDGIAGGDELLYMDATGDFLDTGEDFFDNLEDDVIFQSATVTGAGAGGATHFGGGGDDSDSSDGEIEILDEG